MVNKIFINMDYVKHYNLLIESRRDRVIDPNGYYEKHHIIPKSLGGSNDPINLILLTAREHFIAHWLLWRIYKNKEMAFAFYSITHMGNNQLVKSSRIYEECKMVRRQFIIENNKKYHTGKKISKEHIKIMRDSLILLGRTKSHCNNISKSLKNKPKSEEHKENLSKSLKNYDWSNHIERNNKISVSNGGEKNGRAKQVYIKNIVNDVLITFGTMKDAIDFINENRVDKISKTTFWRKCVKGSMVGDYYISFS